MGTITFSVTTTPVSGSKQYTISDADMTNLINWAMAYFAPPAPAPPLTQTQALVAWTQWAINTTIDHEHTYRGGNAAQNAIAGTPPMAIT